MAFYGKLTDEERDKLREKDYENNLRALFKGLQILGSPTTGDTFTDAEIRRVCGNWLENAEPASFEDFTKEWK